MTSDKKPGPDRSEDLAPKPVTHRRVRRWLVFGAWGAVLLAVTTLVVPSFLMELTMCRGTNVSRLRNGESTPPAKIQTQRAQGSFNGSPPFNALGAGDRAKRIYTLGRDGARGREGANADVDNFDAR